MNKAKIALTAIALFALVGGAVAFKAQRSAVIGYYGPTNTVLNPNRACTLTTTVFLTDQAPQSIRFSTTTLASNCPITFTTAVE